MDLVSEISVYIILITYYRDKNSANVLVESWLFNLKQYVHIGEVRQFI